MTFHPNTTVTSTPAERLGASPADRWQLEPEIYLRTTPLDAIAERLQGLSPITFYRGPSPALKIPYEELAFYDNDRGGRVWTIKRFVAKLPIEDQTSGWPAPILPPFADDDGGSGAPSSPTPPAGAAMPVPSPVVDQDAGYGLQPASTAA